MRAAHYIHFVILQWFWLIFWQKSEFFSFKECPNKISAKNSNFEQKQLQCHLGPYILKSFEHVGMFKTYRKVKKQVWFYPAMLLIVSCPLLQTVNLAFRVSNCTFLMFCSISLSNWTFHKEVQFSYKKTRSRETVQ